MDTLPNDLSKLLDDYLSPYETLLLNTKLFINDTKWFWYNYRQGKFNYEIIKLCKKADDESLKLIHSIISDPDAFFGLEQVHQILRLSLRKQDDKLLNIVLNLGIVRGGGNTYSYGLMDIITLESILHNKYHMFKEKYCGLELMPRCTLYAMKTNNHEFFEDHPKMLKTKLDIEAVLMYPNCDFAQLYNNILHGELLRLVVMVDKLELLKYIFRTDSMIFTDPSIWNLFKVAVFNNSHAILDYLIDHLDNTIMLNHAHKYGYYYRPFWEKIVSRDPHIVHKLKIFKPLEDTEVVEGISIERIELETIKILFELSPPSKRELYTLIYLAKEHGRYDIYCYAWELVSS